MSRRKRVQHEGDEQGRDDDTARGTPHVPRRDVAPPPVVEAEDDEHRKLDADHEQADLPVEQVLVEGRNRRVETDPEREPPRDEDQDRVGEQIEDPVTRDRERHATGAPTAARTTSTTRSCCSAATPAHSGTEKFSRASFSVSGNEPSA